MLTVLYASYSNLQLFVIIVYPIDVILSLLHVHCKASLCPGKVLYIKSIVSKDK